MQKTKQEKRTNDFDIFKCVTLIRMLKKRNQDPQLALKNYSQRVYEVALKAV